MQAGWQLESRCLLYFFGCGASPWTSLQLNYCGVNAVFNRSMASSALMRRFNTTWPIFLLAESDEASSRGLTSTMRTASSTRYSHSFSPCSKMQRFVCWISGFRRQEFSFHKPPNSHTLPTVHPSERKKYFTNFLFSLYRPSLERNLLFIVIYTIPLYFGVWHDITYSFDEVKAKHWSDRLEPI